ncbi:hypothetical protein QBC36DRAFT_178467 [Triangularia setosa]|uniref:Uncharacterized protein n=1 Tax=Triangularia setosa TaxID=2587417 RepID=A0AAN6WFA8_9PEZI|nr:hypothetical protein QBC36DRAFT_178467 [Podospora setosa]
MNNSGPTSLGAANEASLSERHQKRRRADCSPSPSPTQQAPPSGPGQTPLSSLTRLSRGGRPDGQTSISEFSSQINPKAPKRGWQTRRLLQQIPGPKEKEAVSIFSIDKSGFIGEKVAINVIYEDNLQQSLLSSSVVRCLGMDSEDLPVKRCAFFSESSGLIHPQQYVEVAMEQVDMDSGGRKSQLGDMLVVDSARFKPGVHAVLRRDFFERGTRERLTSRGSERNTYQPRAADPYLFAQSVPSSTQSNSEMSGHTGNSFVYTATSSMGRSFDEELRIRPNYNPQNAYTGMPMLTTPTNLQPQGYSAGSMALPGNFAQGMHPQMLDPSLIAADISPLADPNLMTYSGGQSATSSYWPSGPDWPTSGPGPSFQ